LFHWTEFYRMGACQGACPALKVAVFLWSLPQCFSEAWLLLSRP
jgi:hypothetical protein